MNPSDQRLVYRRNLDIKTTSGLCNNYLQTNLITLPKQYAFDFLLFCQRNPKSCPLIEVLEAGNVTPTIADADIRTDIPKYWVYESGVFSKEVLDICDVWEDDFISFLIGCSFTFEKALKQAGIRMLHQEQDKVVPMFKTNIPCVKAGIFEGNMVVSMRALKQDEVKIATKVTEQFKTSHGAPIHIGKPSEIGITDIKLPDYGESVNFDNKERLPVFWPCGVTPQNVCLSARPTIMISHAPGHMLITDRKEEHKSL